MKYQSGKQFAAEMDSRDPLAVYRDQFYIPKTENGEDCIYLCGNSLGLQPKAVKNYVEQELKDWENLAVDGHFHAKNPWAPYHEFLIKSTTQLTGAKPHEVVVMNTLTVNLHLMMVSFYCPTPERHKILIEYNAFPSDQYAVKSQLKYHGYDPKNSLIELQPANNEEIVYTEDMASLIEKEGDSIALILIGGVNYYSGQLYDMREITRLGQKKEIMVGFDLAHAIGNVPLKLHDWNVDFAAWCTYKYLNSGPGSIAGCFIHERHARQFDIPRFEGWWGHDKKTRFLMGPEFQPIYGAEGWQLSNPPILPLASLRASMKIFDEAGMQKLRHKSILLTGYLEFLIDGLSSNEMTIITPRSLRDRGSQLSIKIHRNGKNLFEKLTSNGIICDWREPDIIRVAPVPLYNSFTDVYRFIETLKKYIT